ncbi:putative RING/U-box superfamily protein [Sesbania bispinosa]|nr:putative RING/U-box superfamily protein [Sesbania bispinosa]
MNTVRPPLVTHTVPPEAAHNNSITPQLQLQPSNETIQTASQGTGARFMQLIPTPKGHHQQGLDQEGHPQQVTQQHEDHQQGYLNDDI